MAIRLTIPSDEPSAFRHAVSPLVEAVLSLHVLVDAKGHPLQHGWVREMRRLSPVLKRRVRELTFLYEDALPDCFLPPDGTGPGGFEAELARIAVLDADTVAYEFARPLFHYHEPAAGGPEALGDPAVRSHVIEFAGYHGAESRRLATLIFDDPIAFRDLVVGLLEEYWEEAFAAEWARLEPELLAGVAEAEAAVRDGSLWELLAEHRPALRVDPAAGWIERRSPHAHEVAITPESPLLLLASVYVWPHARVNCDVPWPLAVIYAPRFVTEAARGARAPEDLVRALRAAADPTRLAALRLIAERPRSTEELAPLVGISETGLSKHLRHLAAAGLVTTRRQGYYVLYSIDESRLAELGPALTEFVAGGNGS